MAEPTKRTPACAPTDWVIVSRSDSAVVTHAMCACGDDGCGWTAAAYHSQWVNSGPEPRLVPLDEVPDACLAIPDPARYRETFTTACLLDAGHTGCHVAMHRSGERTGFQYARAAR